MKRASSIVRELEEEVERLQSRVSKLLHDRKVDRLTGIYNELALREHVKASRFSGWYVFSDINGMGKLNKLLGHDRVDEYIMEFAEALRGQVRLARDTDRICDAIATRRSGDEFLVWCSNKRGAQRIRNWVRRWKSEDGRVSVSAGIGKELEKANFNMFAHKERMKK